MSPFLIVLFGAFALVYGTIVVLLLRRPLIGRIAVREAARRPGQTTLIVAGLMIAGAAIFSTQLLEDSQNQWNRSAALKTWGHDDIEVTGGGALFDSGLAQQLAGDSSVNTSGATFQNALVATGSVIDLDRNLGKPGVQVTGLDLVAEPHFGNFVLTTGRASVGAELAAGGLFVTQPLADAIGARVGDHLRVQMGGPVPAELAIRGIVKRESAGAYGADRSAFGSLATVQGLAGTDRVNLVRISAPGDGDSELAAAHRMAPALKSAVAAQNLQLLEVKRAALQIVENANGGRPFVTSFGLIVALAATAMVVNLAVMLAEERRPRLAVLRAMGLSRAGLVQLSAVEGSIYSLLGALAGLPAVFIVVLLLVASLAFNQTLGSFKLSVQPMSVIASVAGAALINFVTVLIVSLRTSRMEISAAIRDLPDPDRTTGTSRVRFGLLGLAGLAGLVAVAAGQPPIRLLGGAVAIASASGFFRGRLSDRVRFSAAGAAAAVWAIAYYSYSNPRLSSNDQTSDFAAALPVTVIALSILVAANLTLVEPAAGVLGRLSGGLRATLRPALAYSARRPLRSGLVIAAFSLVMAVLILVEALISVTALDYQLVSGGWDVRVAVVGSQQLALPSTMHGEVARQEVFPSRTFLGPVKWVYSNFMGTADWHQEPVTVYGLSDSQLTAGIMPLANRDNSYPNDAAAWAAIASDPTLVAGEVAVGSLAYLATDKGTLRFKVVAQIPSVNGSSPGLLPGLVASERSLTGLNAAAPGATMLIRAAKGTDPRKLAEDVQRAVLGVGADATTVRQITADDYRATAGLGVFLLLLLRVGLLVGVTSLGAVALRAVVERRRSIGVLRAVGFQPAQILLGMFVETVLVATAGLAVGIGVALGIGVTFLSGLSNHINFTPDLGSLLLTVGLVYIAVLLATVLPALRAARLRPAEALRAVG